MIGFALDVTTQAVVTFFVGLLSGAGGFAGIKTYVLRPRVQFRSYTHNLVRSRSRLQQDHLEKVLQEQGLPTAVTEVSWQNTGKRAAKALVLEIVVPSKFFQFHMDPDDSGSVVSPWSAEESKTGDGHKLKLHQALLLPNSHCKLTLEHDRFERGPHITFLEGDREIVEGDLMQPSPFDRWELPLFSAFALSALVIDVFRLEPSGWLSTGLLMAAIAGVLVALTRRYW